jgi:hypothetical protein
MQQAVGFSESRQNSLLENKYPLIGSCRGNFAFTIIDASLLQALLPSGLTLAEQPFAPEGQHPLLLMFNETHLESNSYLNSFIESSNTELNLNYNEFIVMLPFVQFKDNALNTDGPYCYLPVLYLDSLLAVLGGRIFWEFNKIMARFDVSPTNFSVGTEIMNHPLFNADFSVAGDPVIGTSLPNFQDIIPILKLPVIEHGVYGYVASEYKIAYNGVEIIPVNTSITNNSCKYLPFRTVQVPGIQQDPMGAFSMTYNWELSFIKLIRL